MCVRYKDGFYSVQGNTLIPIAPAMDGLAGVTSYVQGFDEGMNAVKLQTIHYELTSIR